MLLHDPKQVICLLDTTEKKQAIVEVVERLPVFRAVPDELRFKRAIFRREKVETTGIGHGVAVAHGKILGLNGVLVGLGLSKEGIDYGSIDGKPVHLLFVVASSPSTQMLYLKLLCRLLGSARRSDIRQSLDNYQDEQFSSFSNLIVNDAFSWLWQEPMPTLPRR